MTRKDFCFVFFWWGGGDKFKKKSFNNPNAVCMEEPEIVQLLGCYIPGS